MTESLVENWLLANGIPWRGVIPAAAIAIAIKIPGNFIGDGLRFSQKTQFLTFSIFRQLAPLVVAGHEPGAPGVFRFTVCCMKMKDEFHGRDADGCARDGRAPRKSKWIQLTYPNPACQRHGNGG